MRSDLKKAWTEPKPHLALGLSLEWLSYSAGEATPESQGLVGFSPCAQVGARLRAEASVAGVGRDGWLRACVQ